MSMQSEELLDLTNAEVKDSLYCLYYKLLQCSQGVASFVGKVINACGHSYVYQSWHVATIEYFFFQYQNPATLTSR